MGREARCILQLGNRVASGRARLESAELVFRGDTFRLAIAFQEIRSLEVEKLPPSRRLIRPSSWSSPEPGVGSSRQALGSWRQAVGTSS